jgi:hypothetical protein
MQPFAPTLSPTMEPACTVPPAGMPCVGMRLDLSDEYAAVDVERALEDFNGNAAAVRQLLCEFVRERGNCARKLAGLQDCTSDAVRAGVRDVANTLDAGWCRQAAMAVRRLEERLRRGAPGGVELLLSQAHFIVQQAFDGVETVLHQCPQCLRGRMN